MEEGVPPEGMPVMQGYMSTAKGRRYWVLHRDGRLEGYKQPQDATKGKKPATRSSVLHHFVDEPGGPNQPAEKNVFSLVPISMGKSSTTYTVDTDKVVADTANWTNALTKVIEGTAEPSEAWARSLNKTKLQVWTERAEDHTEFVFRVSGSGGEWSFKQRFSGLERWHQGFVKPAHGKDAPDFPAKHKLKAGRQGEKFTEQRRQDLCRYFIRLLALPGFLQSAEMDQLLNKKANEALADKKRGTVAVKADIESALVEAEDFDESTLEASEEWLNLHRAATPGRLAQLSSPDAVTARLLNQQKGSAWLLNDQQLDLAAFEMLHLTMGTSSSLLSPKERETLELMAVALNISKRKREELVRHMLGHEQATAGASDSAAVNAESSQHRKQGYLELVGKKGKLQKYWFRLTGLELEYNQLTGNGTAKHVGTINLEECTSCRPDQSSAGDTVLIECRGGVERLLKAPSDADCREWIKKIHEAIAEYREAAGADDDDDGANEDARLVDHRFQVLLSKSVEDFGGDAQAFLRWRQRQIVVFISAVIHSINMFRTLHTNFDASFDGLQKKLYNQCDKLLTRKTGSDEDEWTADDQTDYETRLQRIEEIVASAYDIGRRASTDGESYMEWYPLAISNVLYERLIVRTCFDEAEYGGGLREDNVAQFFSILKQMGSRLGYVAGVHDACYAMALLEQYKLSLNPVLLELLQSTIEKCAIQHESMSISCVQLQFVLIQQFCAEKLSDYHKLEDRSHVAVFTKIFNVLHLTLQNTRARQNLIPADSIDDGEALLSSFIERSVEKNYTEVKKMAEGQAEQEDNPMQKLRRFVELLKEEMEDELTEFTAYMADYHQRPAVVAGKKMAQLLNVDLKKVKFDLADVHVMPTWSELKQLELKIICAMESGSVHGDAAKVLELDEQMADVAFQWVEQQTTLFEERVQRVLASESWEAVSEDQYISASAIDIVTMLMQVAKGYFDNELPVTEKVMKQLTQRFGEIIQRYCRITLQQCGDMPKPGFGLDSAGDSKPSAALGKLGTSVLGGMREATKTLGFADEDPSGQDVQETTITAVSNTPALAQLCVRFSTVQYLSGQANDLLDNIVGGAESANYTGAPLDDVLKRTQETLHDYGKTIAEHIGANLVCVQLRSQFCEQLYSPSASASPLINIIPDIDVEMEEIMPRIPLEFHPILLKSMAQNVVQILDKHVRGWNKRVIQQEDSVLSLGPDGDVEIVNQDLDELDDWLKFCGLDEEQIAAETSALRKMVQHAIYDSAVSAV